MKHLGPAIFFALLALLGYISQPTSGPISASSTPAREGTIAVAGAVHRVKPTPEVTRGQAGFYRLTQDSAGVWWLLNSHDQRQFLTSAATVQPITEADSSDLNTWAQATLKKLRDMGFCAIGPGSHAVFHLLDVPTFRDLNIWTSPANSSRRFYDADFAPAAEQTIKSQVELLATNANLVGYFLDNNLDFTAGAFSPQAYFDQLPGDDPNRAEVMKVIQSTWYSAESFNADWDTSIKSFSELNNWAALPASAPTAALNRLRSAWIAHLAHDYFSFTATRIRNIDANHLIFGIRASAIPPGEVLRAAREFTDAQSLNIYASDARLDLAELQRLYEQTRQPVFISEYSFHCLENGSGATNRLVNLPGQVPDQQARADGYAMFTTCFARLPFVIGADWYQFGDTPDLNVGLFDTAGHPYDSLLASIRQTTGRLMAIHAQSASEAPTDTFRESQSALPVAHIPLLEKPIDPGAHLPVFPPSSKLQGLQQVPTVGIERFRQPLPNVYLSWSPGGLYIGLELFNSTPLPASFPDWRAGDHVDVLISTRPISSDQERYNSFAHHFVLLPNSAGTLIGQVHHAGDALKSNLFPCPKLKPSAEQYAKDRSVIEFIIPAELLNGFDPAHQPSMSFNIVIHDQARCHEYFWSAPPQVATQNRPQTWGTIYLESPSGRIATTTQSAGSPPQGRAD